VNGRFVYFYLTTCLVQYYYRTDKNCFPNMSKNIFVTCVTNRDVNGLEPLTAFTVTS